MTGDSDDVRERLRSALPTGWFSDDAPVLTAVLQGFAAALAFAYSLYAYARQQTRIMTATDGWLDMIAADFFGTRIRRKSGQTDASFRNTIRINLFRERGTRRALVQVLTDITGNVPEVFEPAFPPDTGGLGAGLYLGAAGGIGSVVLPYQCFVKIKRPPGLGLGSIAGLGSNTFGLAESGNAAVYGNSMVDGVTDADIYEAINSVKPEGTIVWTQIHS